MCSAISSALNVGLMRAARPVRFGLMESRISLLAEKCSRPYRTASVVHRVLLSEHGAPLRKLVLYMGRVRGCIPRTKINSGLDVSSACSNCDVDIVLVHLLSSVYGDLWYCLGSFMSNGSDMSAVKS
jgi:hypothetical protein